MRLNFVNITQKQRNALQEVKELLDIELAEDGVPITVQRGNNIIITGNTSGVCIEYTQELQFIRTVGLLVENLKKQNLVEVSETPCYQNLGIMIDCSRNAVPHRETFRKMVRHLALMGYSSIQLYMEDTFELKNYPYFGYLRGRYSKEELKEMDQYADLFSIELLPAIQTLAHLDQILKWDSMEELRDIEDILLVDDEKTYELIEAIVQTMSECFTSKRINIGMDEAHMVGLGKYLDRHGYVNRIELMLKHINKVMEIVRKYDLEPMMWSDMFFRLLNNGEYYETDCEFAPELLNKIPEGLTFVYWDYYSEQKEIYDSMLRKHLEMSPNIIFAGGAWKWMGFSPNSHFSEKVGKIAHESCRENKIKEVLVTLWGDNGAECSLFSVMPALMMWAELCYENNDSDAHLKTRFATCTNMNYEDFMKLDLLMLTPDNPNPGMLGVNPPKYIFYQDILLGLFDKHIKKDAYREYFHSCTEAFDGMRKRNGEMKDIFETQYRMSKVLELKCAAGIEIRRAYKENDTEVLKQYAYHLLPQLSALIKDFIEAYRKQWLSENKVFGLEVLELRYGGLLQRIDFAKLRITEYLNQQIEHIEELEEEILPFDEKCYAEDLPIHISYWHRMVTSSIISHI